MSERTKSLVWKILVVAAVSLAVIAFTPLVIPPDRYTPFLFGMPFTLWSGLLIAVLFVVLTWMGSKVYPYSNPEKPDRI